MQQGPCSQHRKRELQEPRNSWDSSRCRSCQAVLQHLRVGAMWSCQQSGLLRVQLLWDSKSSLASARTLSRFFSLGDVGSIHYYPRARNYVAFCRAPGHEECRRSRTVNAAASNRSDRQGQGRPIGFLAHWLFCGKNHKDKDSHAADIHFALSDRIAARERLMRLPQAAEFVQHERPQRPGEPSEPADIS